MARPRTPIAKARAEGRHLKNPQRYRRNEPSAAPLGDPPSWLSDAQAAVWHQFAGALPWLNHSHRALVEISSVVRARLTTGEDIGVQALNLLRLSLGSMGLTPVDASKVAWAADDDGHDDLLD